MLRIGSAIVLLALVVTTIWILPFWATLALATLAAAVAGAELAGMAAAVGAGVPRLFVAIAAAAVTVVFCLSAGDGHEGTRLLSGGADASIEAAAASSIASTAVASGIGLLPALLVLVLAAALVTLSLGDPGPATFTRAAVLVMAPLYVGLPLGALAWIQGALGPGPISWVLAVIAVSDSAQYYTGRAFGRTKLAPAISPGKTREGALGGVAAAALAGVFLGSLWLPGMSTSAAAATAFVLALFGMAGDLFESLLKRSVGLKDSSALIPGHGGVLDRVDSHLFAAPVFYLIARGLG